MSLHEPAPLAPARRTTWTRFRAAWSPALSRDPSGVPLARDPRLDMFRGLALVMIFINHVPGTIYENFTNRNFGFSDAAEAFVFMSGLAAGLAYSNSFRHGSLWSAIARVWARARQLYFVHLTITFISLGIVGAAALWFAMPEVLLRNNIDPLFSQPLAAMIGIPLLTHQLGYLNILPLYAVLLVLTPLVMLVGLKRPWLMLGLSVVTWILAGQFRLNFPNYPNTGGWFFNPFSWQILFVIGLLSGAAMKVGQGFIPYNRALYAVAVAFLVLVLLWVKVPVIGETGQRFLSLLSKAGAPFYLTWFDKSFLTLPRLLHALALFYVLGHLPLMLTFAGSRYAAPLRTLGRQGLAVFATGTVLSLFFQVLKLRRDSDPLFDGLLLGGGLLFLWGLAHLLTYTASLKTKPQPQSSAA